MPYQLEPNNVQITCSMLPFNSVFGGRWSDLKMIPVHHYDTRLNNRSTSFAFVCLHSLILRFDLVCMYEPACTRYKHLH